MESLWINFTFNFLALLKSSNKVEKESKTGYRTLQRERERETSFKNCIQRER